MQTISVIIKWLIKLLNFFIINYPRIILPMTTIKNKLLHFCPAILSLCISNVLLEFEKIIASKKSVEGNNQQISTHTAKIQSDQEKENPIPKCFQETFMAKTKPFDSTKEIQTQKTSHFRLSMSQPVSSSTKNISCVRS